MLRQIAVRHVKPWLSEEGWRRLRRLAPGAAVRDAEAEVRKARRRAKLAEARAKAALVRAEEAERRAGLVGSSTAGTEGLGRLRLADDVDLSKQSLTSLARHFGTDKWGKIHRYTPHYERHLRHLKNERFTLLEIGIGGYKREGQGGASLRMWQAFFPNARIIGLDLQDKSFANDERITTYQGSQTDEAVLKEIVDHADNLQVIIDDGSHQNEHIRRTFEILFPTLPAGGVYAIEDMQTSYWPRYGGSRNLDATDTSVALLKSLIDDINYEEYTDEGYEPTYTQANVVGIHAYHNLAFIDKGPNNEGRGRRS